MLVVLKVLFKFCEFPRISASMIHFMLKYYFQKRVLSFKSLSQNLDSNKTSFVRPGYKLTNIFCKKYSSKFLKIVDKPSKVVI